MNFGDTGIQRPSDAEPYLRVEAWDDSGLVGHLTVQQDEDGWYLYNVLVYDTHRGQGIAVRMLELAVEQVGAITRTNQRTPDGDDWWAKRA